MRLQHTAEPFVPQTADLKRLAEAAEGCRGCALYRNATQVVFGAGTRTAPLVIIGEQPGDREDLTGEPFVGPAGVLLRHALVEAGLALDELYISNAVKHFKFERHGKRRLHKKPSTVEILACRPWLMAELDSIRPRLVLCLGATAIRSCLNHSRTVSSLRGVFEEYLFDSQLTATVHPSALLRINDHDSRELEYKRFVEDLRSVKKRLRKK